MFDCAPWPGLGRMSGCVFSIPFLRPGRSLNPMEDPVRYRLGRQSASIVTALVLGATGAVSGGALALPQAPSGPTAGVAGLPEDLDALLADSRLNGGHAGVVVRRADTGEIIYSRNGDKR